MLHIRDRPRNGRLGNRKPRCRFRHAAGLSDGEKDMQIAELEPASNAVVPIHSGPYNQRVIAISELRITHLYPLRLWSLQARTRREISSRRLEISFAGRLHHRHREMYVMKASRRGFLHLTAGAAVLPALSRI